MSSHRPRPGAHAGLRVLWAEDAMDDQFLIRQSINRMGDPPQVAFHGDGESLCRAVAERRPDLAVLDIQMPVLDGIEALRHLRSTPHGRDLPAVIFSTARHDKDVSACRDLDVSDFVQKPAPFDLFSRAVAHILALAAPSTRSADLAHLPRVCWPQLLKPRRSLVLP